MLHDVVPKFIKAHLVGNMNEFKPMMGEAVLNKLMADIRIVSMSFDCCCRCDVEGCCCCHTFAIVLYILDKCMCVAL